MSLLTHNTPEDLWQNVIKNAENQCSIILKKELETYLVSLLIRYTNQPDITKKLFATAYLEAVNLSESERNLSLQHVGDQCLLVAGLFPHIAERKLVKIRYFVDLGRSAYVEISRTANDLYWSLAYQFVILMDVLQSIRPEPNLLPLEAYEQWSELGSQRALKLLQEYTKSIPYQNFKQ